MEATSREAFANYRAWQKHIKNQHPKLPPRHSRDGLLLYCLAMAMEGTNGIGCYAGNQFIADQLEWNRDTVAKYKTLAIALGWFVYTGKRKGRAPVIDIAIPTLGIAETYDPTALADEPDSKPARDKPVSVPKMPAETTGHADASTYDCPRCIAHNQSEAIQREHDDYLYPPG